MWAEHTVTSARLTVFISLHLAVCKATAGGVLQGDSPMGHFPPGSSLQMWSRERPAQAPSLLPQPPLSTSPSSWLVAQHLGSDSSVSA